MQRLLCPFRVGRERESDLVNARLDAALDGWGGVAFIVGHAGIGKTRLAAALAEEAGRRGASVLIGRGVPSEVPVPYRPVAEALLQVPPGTTVFTHLEPVEDPVAWEDVALDRPSGAASEPAKPSDAAD